NNENQSWVKYASSCRFNDTYPSGGNYWSDYTGEDDFLGYDQDLLGSDGIGDTPYLINTSQSIGPEDNYPLMEPVDMIPPAIQDARCNPDPQEPNGYANLSAVITDFTAVYRVWVEIYDPSDELVGNFSMDYDINSNRYFKNRSYADLGEYTYTIMAKDTNNYWALKSGTLTIKDSTPPTIDDITVMHDLQEFGLVNISADIMDNHELVGAWIDINNPLSENIGNFSMTYDASAGRYLFNNEYVIQGEYSFTIWARDASGNWQLSSGIFDLNDTIPPIAYAGTNVTVLQGESVFFDGYGTFDNNGTSGLSYTWTFMLDNEEVSLNGSLPDYRFDVPGNYYVTLTVTDAAGNWDDDVILVTVRTDTDYDGIPDDEDTDDDGDGYQDVVDSFPWDSSEWEDFDDDGIGDNADPDDDNDMIPDERDDYPLDPTRWEKPEEGDFGIYIVMIIMAVVVVILVLLVLRQRAGKRGSIDEDAFEEVIEASPQEIEEESPPETPKLLPPPPPPSHP
ncbi:MAG: hypothetical protein KAS67_08055, partial [Thermoplasmata archaeon]|nr:hypothetical protein [Thermoplasmata archaeon]